MSKSNTKRVLKLPDCGRLLYCTDLHGNLRDFRRMVELFSAAKEEDGTCQLLFCGDLIHGPCYSLHEWPDYLGSYYEDESGQLVEEFMLLQREHPGQVHCLLGNHEHSHIGGPHTPKFWQDETAYFEAQAGPEAAERYRDLFRTFPLVAVSDCGVVFTHAAPNAHIAGPEDIEAVAYDGHEEMNLTSVYTMPLLGRLLWARRCPEAVAAHFLRSLGGVGTEPKVVVYGHDIAIEGFARFGDNQLMVSTSFGLDNADKRYLEIDLAKRYGSAHDLEPDRELRLLHT